MRTKTFLILAALGALLLSACSRVNQENYEKLKTGMAYEEVRNVLGKPDSCSETIGIRHCRWGGAERYIEGNFVADKAVMFSSRNIQ